MDLTRHSLAGQTPAVQVILAGSLDCAPITVLRRSIQQQDRPC